eukprot:16445527-Heterocapsa_arctica.AAC.1
MERSCSSCVGLSLGPKSFAIPSMSLFEILTFFPSSPWGASSIGLALLPVAFALPLFGTPISPLVLGPPSLGLR